MKSKLRLFSIMICLTLLISVANISPVQAEVEAGDPNIPYQWLPIGITYTKTPTFHWIGVPGSTYYRISVYRRSDNQHILYNVDLNPSVYCRSYFCKYTPTTFDNPMVYGTEYKWKIAAGNASGLGAYSYFEYFTPKPGINSTFTSAATGWQPKVGSWRVTADGYYKGTSSTNQYVSVRYDGIFENFTYEAKLLKPGNTSGYGYGLIIRGDTSAYRFDKMWNTGYFFSITDVGGYAIYRLDPVGAATTLSGWYYSDAIDRDGFNTLKVVANGNLMNFYINGVFVDIVRDTTYDTGRVGVIGYYDNLSINIDYAKLTMPAPYYSNVQEAAKRPANCTPDPNGCFITQP